MKKKEVSGGIMDIEKRVRDLEILVKGLHYYFPFNEDKDGILDRLTKLEQFVCKHTNQSTKCKDCGKEL